MKLAFERAIKNALFPVIHRKSHKIDNSFKTPHFEYTTTYEKPFNLSVNHFMMINIIHDIYLRNFFSYSNGGLIPKTYKDPAVYESAGNIYTGDSVQSFFDSFVSCDLENEPKGVKITELSYLKILERYPFVLDAKINARKLMTILRQINSAFFCLKVKIVFLEVKKYTFKNNEEHTKVTRKLKNFSTIGSTPTKLMIFRLAAEKCDDRGLRDFEFTLDFSTFFGWVMVQGITKLNLDWIDERIYSAPVSEYAKLMYLLLLAGKQRELTLNLGEVSERLCLTNQKPDQVDKTVKNLLEQLHQAEFIEKFSLKGKVANRRFEVLKN